MVRVCYNCGSCGLVSCTLSLNITGLNVLNNIRSIDTSACRKPGDRIATRRDDKTKYLITWLGKWNTYMKTIPMQ